MKIEGSGSGSESGSGSISQRHGSADPDSHQNAWIRNTDSGDRKTFPAFVDFSCVVWIGFISFRSASGARIGFVS
jgi:hypothetical protein